jgi:hypothetical protein
VERQSQSIGTVTLTSGAPTGGAVVALESSNRDVVKVPASVMVPAGSTSATFTIETSTVTSTTRVNVTAQYLGVSATTIVTVMPTVARAAFTVTSPTYGADSCRLVQSGQSFDCLLDGSASQGILQLWTWTLGIGTGRIREVRTTAVLTPDTQSGCNFVEGGSTNTDSSGRRYVEMTIELVVEDREGLRSPAVTRAVRLYPEQLCGYSF